MSTISIIRNSRPTVTQEALSKAVEHALSVTEDGVGEAGLVLPALAYLDSKN